MEELIKLIQNEIDKKKVQSLCKKILKKCSFNSERDLGNITDLATWLYIYGEEDKAVKVCELLENMEFTGNYNLWDAVDMTQCLKARICRLRGLWEEHDRMINRVNEHRNPELYGNNLSWYRQTLKENIKEDETFSPRSHAYGWRLVEIQYAIQYLEAGGFPIPDEEFEKDIQADIDILKQMK